jgi:hypothetical protein
MARNLHAFTTSGSVTLPAGELYREAAHSMGGADIGCILVEREGCLYGLFAGRDLVLSLLAEGRSVPAAQRRCSCIRSTVTPEGPSPSPTTPALALVFVGPAGWSLMSEGMRALLREAIDFDTMDAVREIIRGQAYAARATSLIGRGRGEAQCIDGNMVLRMYDVGGAHTIGRRIESEICRRIPHVARARIHCEPAGYAAEGTIGIIGAAGVSGGKRTADFDESPCFALVWMRPAGHP